MNFSALDSILLHQINARNDLKILLSALSTRKNIIGRKRKKNILKLSNLLNKHVAISHKIFSWTKKRSVWTKIRSKTFWEKDVAMNNGFFFKENFRMSRETFNILCDELRGLEKEDTNYRKAIPLRKRVAIALYTVGSSAEYRSIANLFGVGKTTVCNILKSFCQEVWKMLRVKYMTAYPLTRERIVENVNGFQKLGFPQCFGAIDGCHIEVSPRSEDAVDYFNYKGWYSTVLFAAVDYRYRFLYINVGSPGRCNDSQIFEKSSLKVQHQNALLQRMSKKICDVDVPVLLIGDSAFRFSDRIMKPYPFNVVGPAEEKNFNYALSKCRRVVENAFGHLKARFRRIGKGLENHIDNTSLIIKSCCVLHNFLNEHNDAINIQWLQILDENTTREQPEHITIDDNNPTAVNIRNAITRYLALDVEATGGSGSTSSNISQISDASEAVGVGRGGDGGNGGDSGDGVLPLIDTISEGI